MKFEDLTPEQREKAKACKMPEDVLALAREKGRELSDEELAVSLGGFKWACSDNVKPCTKHQSCFVGGSCL